MATPSSDVTFNFRKDTSGNWNRSSVVLTPKAVPDGRWSTPTYQWQKWDWSAPTPAWANISGETSATYTVTPAIVEALPDVAPHGLYRCNLTESGNTKPSVVFAVGIAESAVVVDGSIDRSKLATGLEPVETVSSLPALPDSDYPQGAVVFLTTDSKLYRSTGSAWTKAVDGGDITADTILGNSIVAGEITAAHLSVNKLDAITAQMGHLFAGDLEVDTDLLKFGPSSQPTFQITPDPGGTFGAARVEFGQIGSVGDADMIVMRLPDNFPPSLTVRGDVNNWIQLTGHQELGLRLSRVEAQFLSTSSTEYFKADPTSGGSVTIRKLLLGFDPTDDLQAATKQYVDNNFAALSHAHAASDITSGTFADARIPNLDAGKITTGTFADARIPSLAASKITSGTFPLARGGLGADGSLWDPGNFLAVTTGPVVTQRTPAQARGDLSVVSQQILVFNGETPSGGSNGNAAFALVSGTLSVWQKSGGTWTDVTGTGGAQVYRNE